MTYPFSHRAKKANETKYTSTYKQHKIDYTYLKKVILAEIHDALDAFNFSKTSLNLAKNTVQLYETAYTNELRKWKLKLITFEDLLSAKNNLDTARITYFETMKTYLHCINKIGLVTGYLARTYSSSHTTHPLASSLETQNLGE